MRTSFDVADLSAIAQRLYAGEEVRVLSLWQPWASAIANGHKSIETRSWSTEWRGLLVVHATRKGRVEHGPAMVRHDERLSRTHGLGPLNDLPKGALVALTEVTFVKRTHEVVGLDARERELGDYTMGRFAWGLRLYFKLREPILHKGGQGIRTLPRDKVIAIADQITIVERLEHGPGGAP